MNRLPTCSYIPELFRNCRLQQLRSKSFVLAVAVTVSGFTAACRDAPPQDPVPQTMEQATRQMQRSFARSIDELRRSGVREWTITPLLVIDGNRHVLDRVKNVRVAPNGEIVISQPKMGELLVFSPTGDLTRRIGRQGSGPGEFSPFMGTFGFVGDTLWVEDPNARRLTLLGIDGTLRAVIPYAKGPMFNAAVADFLPANMKSDAAMFQIWGPDALSADGSAISLVRPWSEVGSPGPHESAPLVSIARDLKPLRLIALVPTNTVSYESLNGNVRRAIGINPPFGDEFVAFETSPSGNRMAIATADYKTDLLRIVQLSLKGDTLSQQSVPLHGRAVPKSEIDEFAKEAARELERPQDVDAIRAATSMCSHAACWAAAKRGLRLVFTVSVAMRLFFTGRARFSRLPC